MPRGSVEEEARLVIEFAEWLQVTPLSQWIQSHTWITPMVQAIHIVTIGVVFGSVLMVALRVLGRMRVDEPFGTVWRRFAPWLWVGLVIMTATGIVLIVGEPVREFAAKSFWTKMALIGLGIASVLSFRGALGSAVSADGKGVVFGSRPRAVAVATLLIWALIIFFGRAIAYDAEIWASVRRGTAPVGSAFMEGRYAWTSRP
jgi:uncharacterized membrane protein SirB2